MSRLAASSFAAIFLALSFAGCDLAERTNQDPARELWSTAGQGIRSRATDLRTQQQTLAGRVNALHVPDGLEDPALAKMIEDLKAQLDPADQACAAVENALTRVTGEVELALSKPNKIAAKQAVDSGLAAFESAATQAKQLLDNLAPQVAAAEAQMQKGLDANAAEGKKLRDLAASGGSIDFSDIDFQAGTAELDFSHPASKATLQRLATFAGTCNQLRFSITGHTSKEGKPAVNKALSLARADAIKSFLTQGGVAAEKITETSGAGAAQPLVDEPDPGTPAESAMAPDALEAVRRKNRRISVAVTTPCTAAVAQPPTEPPPDTRGVVPTTGGAAGAGAANGGAGAGSAPTGAQVERPVGTAPVDPGRAIRITPVPPVHGGVRRPPPASPFHH